MMLQILLRRFLIGTLLLNNNVDGWSWPSKATSVRSFLKGQSHNASSTFLLSLYGLLSIPSLVSADATTIQFSPSPPVITQEQWMQSLTPPTDERPQIIPPTRNNLQLQASPVMEGMVYLLDKNDRPETNDLIVITMTTIDDPNTVLAGAKYPVSRARIPFNFQLKDANVIKGKEDLFRASLEKDLLIQANICPEAASSIPCTKEESTFIAKGISKLVKIPGMKENEQVIVRTAAALPLSRTVQE